MGEHQINRRAFIKKSIGYATCVAFGKASAVQATPDAQQQTNRDSVNDLLQAVEASDVSGASELLNEKLAEGGNAWQIHLSLFPVVQRVLNPPYHNPHLPKMHAICRELAAYLKKEEIAALVRLEVVEYAKRPKLEQLPKAKSLSSSVSFNDVEAAIGDQDWEKSAVLMATFRSQKSSIELARRLLLLGSGYLDRSLGHSISCTAFILLEMLERVDQDPWPALSTLADYFCKGRFYSSPALGEQTARFPDESIDDHLLRATSGGGIVNLHHTITFYALERVRKFFSREEYQHLMGTWIAFLKNKRAQQIALEGRENKPVADYSQFYKTFSKLEPNSVSASVAGMIGSRQSRQKLGGFLIRGVCDQYQGDYNPHNLTGLGSVLWVVDRFWNQTPIAINALFQYLDFFFDDVKSKR